MSKKLIPLIFLLCFGNFAIAQHEHREKPKKIGTVKELYLKMKISDLPAEKAKKEKSLVTSDEALPVIINVSKSVDGKEILIGEVKGKKGSNVSLAFSGGSLEGFIAIPSEETAYSYSSDAQGNAYVSEEDIHDVLCVNYNKDIVNGKAPGAGEYQTLAVPPSSSSVYTLQSLPGATAVAYLDFDGQYVVNSRWNGGNPIDAQPGNFTETDITNIWRMISEDFRAFNLNITTSEAVFNAAPKGRRMRCIFTPTNTAAPGSGGVAYLNSFRWTDDTPCWVFNSGAKAAGEAGSHELGHTFGLGHDGTPSTGYYSGHGIWAPIMGVGYSKGLVQWSRGEYANANNTQDDIAIISNTSNGFGFRADEAGNTIASAKALVVASNGTLSAASNYGIITQRTDIDVYSFSTNGGTVSLTISPSGFYPNLDILASLTNSSGTVLATSNPVASAPGSQTGNNPITGLNATFSINLAAGTYYLHIDGTGQGDPLNTGYSDYASMGEYTISGTIPVGPPANQPPVVSITSPLNNATFTAPANITINANASDPDGTVSSVAFYSGSTLLNTDATSPYSFTWSNVVAGTYTLTARATDNSGAVTTSAAITVTVNPAANQPPVVSIASPLNNATFTAPASITINANASDPDGTVSSVAFYSGSTLLNTDATSPYSFTWSNVAAGTYTLTARATDNSGAVTTSAAITVTVTQSPTIVGISGPSCVVAGQTYLFTLVTEGPHTSISWWTNAQATIQVDPADQRKAYVTYAYNGATVNLSAGVNYSATPWYKQYYKSVQIGGCASVPVAVLPAPAVLTAPHPFSVETSLSLSNGEKILSVKVFDIHGKEVMYSGEINADSFSFGRDLEAGLYILHVITESNLYKKNLIKSE
jgi:hypothetical protein